MPETPTTNEAIINLVAKRFDSLDDRLRAVETKAEVTNATMITWRRLLGVLTAVVVIGSTVFGLAVAIGDRLWG